MNYSIEAENTSGDNKDMKFNKNFWILFWGKIVSQLGEGIFNIALPWYILSVTASATAMSSYYIIGNITCGLVLFLFGKMIDRWKREKIMYLTDYIRGLYILFLLITVLADLPYQFLWIYLGAVVTYICAGLFNPASMSILPSILEENKLTRGNSLLAMVDNTISILGLAVGVAVYQALGIRLVLLVTGIAYILSAITKMFLHPARASIKEASPQKSSTRAGLQYLCANKKLLFIVVFAMTWNYIYISVYSIYIPYIFNIVYKTTIAAIATVDVAMSVGLLLGATLALKFNINRNLYRNLTKVVILQFPVFLLLPFIIFLHDSFLPSTYFIVGLFAVLFFILGMTVAVVNVNISVILQTETKNEFLGRIYSLKSLGSMISMSAGMFLGGIIIEHIPVIVAFSINSVLFAGLTIFMANVFLKKPVMREVKT
jgi:MFS transporter, DHA3 family, macrolide efflux protein